MRNMSSITVYISIISSINANRSHQYGNRPHTYHIFLTQHAILLVAFLYNFNRRQLSHTAFMNVKTVGINSGNIGWNNCLQSKEITLVGS